MGGDPLGDIEILSYGADGHAGRQKNEEREINLAQILFAGEVHAGHEAGHADEGKDEGTGEMMPLFGNESGEPDEQY